MLLVERVYHRPDAIWPFTVVGRPPQEDAMFSRLIHELVGPVIPRAIPGVHAVHAVEAAGVHPLLLAVGSERYVPYRGRAAAAGTAHPGQRPAGPRPVVAGQVPAASPPPRTAPIWMSATCPSFLRHVLERVDWRRDLHFQTCTTMDTLDYSGTALNEGSKVVIAAAGPPLRTLPVGIDSRLALPEQAGFGRPRVFLPGILVVEGPPWKAGGQRRRPRRGSVLCRLQSPRPDERLSPGGHRRPQRFRGADAGQFSLDDLHAERSGDGHLRDRVVSRATSIGAVSARW